MNIELHKSIFINIFENSVQEDNTIILRWLYDMFSGGGDAIITMRDSE